jgi:hypothetical protein
LMACSVPAASSVLPEKFFFMDLAYVQFWGNQGLMEYVHFCLSSDNFSKILVHCIPVTSILWAPEKNMLVTDICLYQVN